jgi:ADP-dependent NAD(P)H-hydrate dehydratase / NAD(P)H-hydrate epimerase
MPVLATPLMTTAQSVTHESARLAGNHDAVAHAMQAVAAGCTRALLADYTELRPWPAAPRILVLAGHGLNGGDALLVAASLGRTHPLAEIHVLRAGERSAAKPLTRQAAGELANCGCAVLDESVFTPELGARLAATRWDVLIDGLLGAGSTGAPRAAEAALIAWANTACQAHLRAAIDLPSGFAPDAPASSVLRADFTYLTATAKSEALAHNAPALCGRLRLIAVPDLTPTTPLASLQGPALLLADQFQGIGALRAATSEKRQQGHVLVLGGSAAMPGAVMMAASAALQTGAGLVTVLAPAPVAPRLIAALPEAMWQGLPVGMDGNLENECIKIVQQAAAGAQCLLIGPGLRVDKATLFVLCRIIREVTLPLVIDASALTPDVVNAVISRPLGGGQVWITPHLGEYRRLIADPAWLFDDESFVAFCRKYRLTAVLKGPVNRLSDGQRLVHISCGGPVLARGGSGDMLAGMLAARVAVAPTADPLETAALTVQWHGAAADHMARSHGQVAVRTTQLLDALAPTLRS